MSSTKELSQCKNQTSDIKPVNHSGDRKMPYIPKDIHGMYGVHVSNFPADFKERDMIKRFSDAGHVRVCKIMDPKPFHDSRPSCYRRYGFVKFSTPDEARAAIHKYDGFSMGDYNLAVSPAYQTERYNVRKDGGPPNKKQGKEWFSDKETRVAENGFEKDENGGLEAQRTSHEMGSTDYRLREGKLLNDEVMTFNCSSGEVSPPKGGKGQVLAPRFQGRFQKTSPPAKTSYESHPATEASPTRMPHAPHTMVAQEGGTTRHRQSPISGAPTSPGHSNGDVQDSCGAASSAFRPYQHTYNQEPGINEHSSVRNGVDTVASAISHLGLSPPSPSATEGKESTMRGGQMQGKDTSTWRQMGGKNMGSWGQTPGTGVASSSSNKDRSACSPVEKAAPTHVNNVPHWSTADVVKFFQATDCADYAGFFQEQEIDGKALMLLNRDTLLHFMKVGPALKVCQLIGELRSAGSTSPVENRVNANGW